MIIRRSEDMRKSIFEDARVRQTGTATVAAGSTTASSTSDQQEPRGRTASAFARPAGIEKHIVQGSSDSRSRNPSESRSSIDSQSLQLKVNNDFRSSRYKHPLSHYSNDHGVEAIVPNHTNMLYQKYRRSQENGKTSSNSSTPGNGSRVGSETELGRASKSTLRTSVSMDNDLVPAFNDLKMDLGDGDNDNDRDDITESNDNSSFISQTSNDLDNKFVSSLELLKKLEKEKHRPSLSATSSLVGNNTSPRNSRASTADSNLSSKASQSPIGRIQQRIMAMKGLQPNEPREERPNRGFSSIQQKVLIESLKRELTGLRRFNQRPMMEAVERVATQYADIQIPKQPGNTIHPVASGGRSIHGGYKEIPIKPIKSASSMTRPSNNNTTKEVNVNKLKTLMKASVSIIEELWEEPDLGLPSGYIPSSSQYSLGSAQGSLLPETRFLREHLENFKYGADGATNPTLSGIDPSPRTAT